jgi:hypothetical protein
MAPLYPLISKGITLLYSFSLLDSEGNSWSFSGQCAEPKPHRLQYISQYNFLHQFADAEQPVPVCKTPDSFIDVSDLVLYRAVLAAVSSESDFEEIVSLVNQIFDKRAISEVDFSRPCESTFDFDWQQSTSDIDNMIGLCAAIISWALTCGPEMPVTIPDWSSIIDLPQVASDHESVCIITSIESAIVYLNSGSPGHPPPSPDICFPTIEKFDQQNLLFGFIEENFLVIPSLSSPPSIPSDWLNAVYPITTCPGILVGTSFDCSVQDFWACTTVGGCTVNDLGECVHVVPGMYAASGDREPSPCDLIPDDEQYVGFGWTTRECPTRCTNSAEYLNFRCEPIPYGFFGNPCPAEPSTINPCLTSGKPEYAHFSLSGCQGHLVGAYMYPITRVGSVVAAETWFKITLDQDLVLLIGVVGQFFIATTNTSLVICKIVCYEAQVVLTDEWHHIYVEFSGDSVEVQLDGVSRPTSENFEFSDLSLGTTAINGHAHVGPLYLSQVPTSSAYSLFAGITNFPEVSFFDQRIVLDDGGVMGSSYTITAPDGWFRGQCLYGSKRSQECASSSITVTTSTTTSTINSFENDSGSIEPTSQLSTETSEPESVYTTFSDSTTPEQVSYPYWTTTLTTTDTVSESSSPETTTIESTTDLPMTITTTTSSSFESTFEVQSTISDTGHESSEKSTSTSLVGTEDDDTSTTSWQSTEISSVSDPTIESTNPEVNSEVISTASHIPSSSASSTSSPTFESTYSETLPASEDSQTTTSTTGIDHGTDSNVMHSLSSTTAMYRLVTTIHTGSTESWTTAAVSIQDSVNLPVIYSAIALVTVMTIACISHIIRILNGRRSTFRVHHYD